LMRYDDKLIIGCLSRGK